MPPNVIKQTAEQIADQLLVAGATSALMVQLLAEVGAITLPLVIPVSQTHAVIVLPGYGPLDGGKEAAFVLLADIHQP